jgi:excisionase family DNA binding protein
MKNLISISFFLAFIISIQIAAAQTGAPVEVLTENEAAELLSIDVSTLRVLAEKGQVPARDLAGQWRFSRQALLSWLAKSDSPQTQNQPKLAEETKGESQNNQLNQNLDDEIESILLRDKSALTPSGSWSGELGVIYSRRDKDTFLLDAQDLASIEQRSVSSVLTMRYGFGEGYQLRATAPYQYSSDRILVDGYELYQRDRSSFGPAQIGIQKQLVSEGPGYPGLIVGVNGLLGSAYGFSIEANISKTLDPVILFAGGQYIHQFNAEALTSENRVNAQVGFGLKLNDDLAAQLALVGHYSGEVVSGEMTSPAQDDFGFNLGLNWRVAKNVFLQPFIEHALTGRGNDLSIGTAIIYVP